ncbi:phage holin [Glutamicibacter creatinolyticus]|uniref:phage holin n=1 Tax=Glutamicibacter creatinolyticus TaxID=162496 RepID=UPI0032180207
MEKFIKSVKGRKYLYRVALAVIGLAVAYGLLDGETAQLWGALALAGLGLAVADGNATNAGADPENAPKHRAE